MRPIALQSVDVALDPKAVPTMTFLRIAFPPINDFVDVVHVP
jgi:hypothetical protein